jgi:pimeloyl-ACP methyl ester carboxylesterase
MVRLKSTPPGRLIRIGKRTLHLNQTGTGTPAVVLEAGIAASSVSWSHVAPLVARHTTVLAYDRGGFGWSGPAASGAALNDLEAVLAASGVQGPYILVGHSFGALLMRLFQQRRPEQAAGMVLVDPVVRAEWGSLERSGLIRRGVVLSRRGAALARTGLVRASLWLLLNGAHKLPRLIARASAGNGASVTERLTGEVRKMPREMWPAVAGHWSRSYTFEAMAASLEDLPRAIQALDAGRSLGNLPITVLSAANATAQGRGEHEHDALLSTRGKHIVVPNSTHWMMLDQPEMVAKEVIAMLGPGTRV